MHLLVEMGVSFEAALTAFLSTRHLWSRFSGFDCSSQNSV